MKREKEIDKRLREVCSDIRLAYKPANVFTNAHLALIQQGLEAEIKTLKWILGIKDICCPKCKSTNVKCRGLIFNCEDCGERW